MLSAITENFGLFSRIGSIGSKVVGLGMTAFGLTKLWSTESMDKHSLPTLTAFSSAYVLHMGTTTLASAVMFGSETMSAPVATALLSSTTLLTSYANLMEAYVSHSILKSKYNVLENKLNASKLELHRNLALIQSVAECQSDMERLTLQIEGLRVIFRRLEMAHKIVDLKKLYLELYEIYQDRIKKNEILDDYFSDVKNSNDVNSVSNDVKDKINRLHDVISQTKTKLQTSMPPKAQRRLENKIAEYEVKLMEYGAINFQCIRYVKIEEHIKLLEELYSAIRQNSALPLDESKRNEIQYLKRRIESLQEMLATCLRPQDNHQTLELEIGEGVTLEGNIKEDPKAFKLWLKENLCEHIQNIEKQRDSLRASAENVERCYREFIKEPTNDVHAHRLKIHEIEQEKTQLKCNISLEKLSKETKRSKLNVSTIASLFALAMCFVPQGELAAILKPLMLGTGLIGGALSIWNLYSQNMLKQKVETQKQSITKRLDAALKFTQATDMTRTLSADLERMLEATKKPEVKHLEKPRRVSHTRAAKGKANDKLKALFFSTRTRTTLPPKQVNSAKLPARKRPRLEGLYR